MFQSAVGILRWVSFRFGSKCHYFADNGLEHWTNIEGGADPELGTCYVFLSTANYRYNINFVTQKATKTKYSKWSKYSSVQYRQGNLKICPKWNISAIPSKIPPHWPCPIIKNPNDIMLYNYAISVFFETNIWPWKRYFAVIAQFDFMKIESM